MIINLYKSFYNEKGCRETKDMAHIYTSLEHVPRIGESILEDGDYYKVTSVLYDLKGENNPIIRAELTDESNQRRMFYKKEFVPSRRWELHYKNSKI